jgi:glutathione S-transferase
MTSKKNLSGLQDFKVLETSHDWTLFHNNFSLCSRKVRICLNEFNTKHDLKHIHIIETENSENLSREFLKINPLGTVPVLLHKGFPIYESHEQIKYIESQSNITLGKSDIVDFWLKRGSLVGEPNHNYKIYAGNCIAILTPPLFVSMLKKIPLYKFFRLYLNHPSKFRAFYFIMFKLFGYSVFKDNSPLYKLASLAAKNIEVHLSNLDDHLSNKMWIDGANFSLADITWMVILHRLEEIQLIDKFSSNKNNLKEYYNRLKKRKSFAECIDNFNHQSIESGIKRLKKEISKNKTLKSFYSSI